MAYTINQGYQTNHELDKVQRGLLIGLPALVLVLILGAVVHRSPVNNPVGINPKLIPIVSTLSNGSSNPSTNGNSTGGSVTAAASGSQTSGSGGLTTSTSGISTLTGGMGGGPATTTSGSSSGILPLNASLYIPPTDVQAGGKSVVNTSGTTLTVN